MSELDKNLAKLEGYLARYQDQGISNLIDGQPAPAAGEMTFKTRSPVDNSLICSVAKSDADDVDRAAEASKPSTPAFNAKIKNLVSREKSST